MEDHHAFYKNASKNVDSMRRLRADFMSDIRKNKRHSNLMKNRSLDQESRQDFENKNIIFADVLLCLMSDDQECVLEGLTNFKNMPRDDRQLALTEIISSNVVPKITDLLSPEMPYQIQLKACHIIASLVSEAWEHTRAVVEAEGIGKLIFLLNGNEVEIKTKVVRTLGTISADNEDYRNKVVQEGAVDPLIREIMNPGTSLEFLEQASWLISILCYCEYSLLPFPILCQIETVFSKFLGTHDVKTISNALWALSYILEQDNKLIAKRIPKELIKWIIDLYTHQSIEVVEPAVNIIANIACFKGLLKQLLADDNYWLIFVHVLERGNSIVSQTLLWCIGNLIMEGIEYIQAAINCRILSHVLQMCREGSFDCQKESAIVLYNVVACGTKEQVEFLLFCDLISTLGPLLKLEDTEIVLVTLKALELLLTMGEDQEPVRSLIKAAGLLNHLDDLQQHNNRQIRKKCDKIMSKYFFNED